MIQGVAYLMKLAPPPEEWTLAAWAKQIGKSPSDMSQEDMWWAQVSAERQWALRVFALLESGTKGAKALDPGEWLTFSELKKEAKKLYAES